LLVYLIRKKFSTIETSKEEEQSFIKTKKVIIILLFNTYLYLDQRFS